MVRTAVETISGALMALTATLPLTYDSAGYSDTDIIWTTLNQIENIGPHGLSANIVPFTPIDTAVTAKMKGTKDYGLITLTKGDLADAGQTLLKAASESNLHYSLRIIYPDLEVHYLDVIVAKYEYQAGSVDDVQKIGCDMAVCRAPVVVAGV